MRATTAVTDPAVQLHPRSTMTRNRVLFFSTFGLSAQLALGCNLDLDDLIDDGDESGESSGGDEGDDASDGDDDGNDEGGDTGNDDDGDSNGDGGDDASDAGDSAADTSGGGDGGEVPADVLGAWVTGTETAAMLLELYDDGTFTQGLYYEYDDEGCYTVGQEAYSGTFVIDATTLVLAADAGVQEIDQCGTLVEGQDVAETVQLAWTLGTDEAGDVLTLDDGSGEGGLVFHRADEGGGEGGV